jgi:hypothetical protein
MASILAGAYKFIVKKWGPKIGQLFIKYVKQQISLTINKEMGKNFSNFCGNIFSYIKQFDRKFVINLLSMFSISSNQEVTKITVGKANKIIVNKFIQQGSKISSYASKCTPVLNFVVTFSIDYFIMG